MLIGLYDKTLETLRLGIAAKQAEDAEQFETERIKAYRLILALLEGIDVRHGDLAQNIQRICLYAVRLVWTGGVDSWEAAIRIIQPLHNSFVQIREEAVAMELEGAIPPLQFDSVFDENIV